MAKDLDRRVNFKIDKEGLERLDQVAARLGLDRSEVARRAIYEGLKEFDRVRLSGTPDVKEAVAR